MAPTEVEALVQQNGKLAKKKIPLPIPGDNQVLVKVAYVAQNPTDVQSLDLNIFGDGAVLGCDYVGTVEEVGANVTRVQKGATIAGLVWGGEVKGLGGYSEYTLADERICFAVPETISHAQGATVPLAVTTAWLALLSKDSLGIDRNSASGQSVLIWGGSSSVGLYTVQIAKILGMNIVTTCSPHHHDNLRSMGANHVFDYRDPDVVAKIKEVAPDLKYVFDTIGNETSSATASQAIVEAGGVLSTVRPGKVFTENVSKQTRVTDVLVWTAFFKEVKYKQHVYTPREQDRAISVELFEKLPEWLSDKTIKPSQVKLFENGLDDVEKGFQEHRDGNISNYKIVYKL